MFLKNKFSSTCFLWVLLTSTYTHAVPDNLVRVSYGDNARFTGPADSAAFATSLTAWGTRGSANVCANQTLNYSVGKIDLVALLPYTGRTYKASSAHRILYLFESGAPGIAFTMRMNGGWLSGSIVNSDSILPGRNTVYEGSMSNENRLTAFPTASFSNLFKDAGRMLDGETPIPGQNLYRFECFDTNGTLQETTTIYQLPFIFYSSVTSCTPTTNNHSIQMRDLRLQDIENAAVGTVFETVQQNFSLICDKDLDVFLTLNDLDDPSNFTNIATLTSDSTAKGIGYQVGSAVSSNIFSFSSPGSTPGYGTRNQYYINRSTSDKQSISYDLRFQYIKTDNEVTEGKAHSLIGITYSYQ